ncbi:MAG: hypothetical protein JNM78_19000 [Cyclobacteriaceae bacterium]|nr:hypothetical protein [Cyclobacteriaceae bacterium]
MEVKDLDSAIQEIATRRNELSKIDYNNPKYDDLEEELHNLEDSIQVRFGEYLEDVLQDIHDEFCPDTDVLYPIAYFAKSYLVNDKNQFSVGPKEGVYVEVDSLPGKETKLVIVPGPLRIVLNEGNGQQKVVWTAKS